jgi:hypothetical protein
MEIRFWLYYYCVGNVTTIPLAFSLYFGVLYTVVRLQNIEFKDINPVGLVASWFVLVAFVFCFEGYVVKPAAHMLAIRSAVSVHAPKNLELGYLLTYETSFADGKPLGLLIVSEVVVVV